jgi:hypothetical protein
VSRRLGGVKMLKDINILANCGHLTSLLCLILSSPPISTVRVYLKTKKHNSIFGTTPVPVGMMKFPRPGRSDCTTSSSPSLISVTESPKLRLNVEYDLFDMDGLLLINFPIIL